VIYCVRIRGTITPARIVPAIHHACPVVDIMLYSDPDDIEVQQTLHTYLSGAFEIYTRAICNTLQDVLL
jgi:hypothetical protein